MTLLRIKKELICVTTIALSCCTDEQSSLVYIGENKVYFQNVGQSHKIRINAVNRIDC